MLVSWFYSHINQYVPNSINVSDEEIMKKYVIDVLKNLHVLIIMDNVEDAL